MVFKKKIKKLKLYIINFLTHPKFLQTVVLDIANVVSFKGVD